MILSFFPNGLERYVIGGLLIGAGVALLFATTGRQGGVSTFFSSSWSWLLRTPFFQQASLRDSRQWRLVYALGLLLGGSLYVLAGQPVEAAVVIGVPADVAVHRGPSSKLWRPAPARAYGVLAVGTGASGAFSSPGRM